MEIVFNAIGIEVPNKTAFNNLAEDAEKRGEASLSTRPGGIVHGRCWRIGLGLEVWTILSETKSGEVFYADCRPGFRARYTQILSDWTLSEAVGEAVVEGFTEFQTVKVFFKLQNLTEISHTKFEQKLLKVGLCGLAYRAEALTEEEKTCWKPAASENAEADQADWILCGKILAFDELRNPFTGSDLYWIHLDLGNFRLEILVNKRALGGEKDLKIGSSLKAKVWLQGHVGSQSTFYSSYEGVDWSQKTVDFWKTFKREN